MRRAAPAGPEQRGGLRGCWKCCSLEHCERAQLRHTAAGLAGSAAHPARVVVLALLRYGLRVGFGAIGIAPFG